MIHNLNNLFQLEVKLNDSESRLIEYIALLLTDL